jgi:hypothetical protein
MRFQIKFICLLFEKADFLRFLNRKFLKTQFQIIHFMRFDLKPHFSSTKSSYSLLKLLFIYIYIYIYERILGEVHWSRG